MQGQADFVNSQPANRRGGKIANING